MFMKKSSARYWASMVFLVLLLVTFSGEATPVFLLVTGSLCLILLVTSYFFDEGKQVVEIQAHSTKKLHVISLIASIFIVLFLISGVGNGYFLYRQDQNQKKISDQLIQISMLEKEVERLKIKVSLLTNDLTVSNDSADFLSDLTVYMSEQLDKLNAVLLKTDNNSIEYITWINEHARFVEEDYSSASYYYGQWLAIQKETNEEYDEIISELSQIVDQLSVYSTTNIGRGI